MLQNKRGDELHIRLLQSEKQRIILAANKCGMTVSAYARDVLLGYSPKAAPPLELDRLMQAIYKAHDYLTERGQKELADELRTAALDYQRASVDPNEQP